MEWSDFVYSGVFLTNRRIYDFFSSRRIKLFSLIQTFHHSNQTYPLSKVLNFEPKLICFLMKQIASNYSPNQC